MVVPNVQVPFRRAVGRRRRRELPGQIGKLFQDLTAQFPEFLILRYQNDVHRHDMHRSYMSCRESKTQPKARLGSFTAVEYAQQHSTALMTDGYEPSVRGITGQTFRNDPSLLEAPPGQSR